MRAILYAAAAASVATLVPFDSLRAALATAAGTLLEATPWIVAGIAASCVLRNPAAGAYLGCGCAPGPSARSIPAAAATWLVFGPAVAGARLMAAIAAARLLRRRTHEHRAHDVPALLDELAALAPAAVSAGLAMQVAPLLGVHGRPAIAQLALGAALGFFAAPCALGSVAIAGALRASAPLCAIGFLCVAGIVDLCALMGRHEGRGARHDALAYALLCAALGVVALRRGDALVHPSIAVALGGCAIVALARTIRHRTTTFAPARIAPALMLLGAFVNAPAPVYRATETTLGNLFPGERLTFTGVLAGNRRDSVLVRYAITCCRADATPVAIRLVRRPPFPANAWLRADGAVVASADGLRLAARTVERIAPPTDPFVYR